MNTDKSFLYQKAYDSLLARHRGNPELHATKETIKKLLFYGIKVVSHMKDLEGDDVEYNFQFAELIKNSIALFTPREIMGMFPIEKKYDGKRWQAKDYFSTVKYIESIGIDNPIGENINHFLWDYENRDLDIFMMRLMSLMDDIRQLEGLPGIMEEFFEKQGLTTYTMHTDQRGKQFLINNKTGKTMKVRPRVRHLRVVK